MRLGTTPPGTSNEEQASRWVQQAFADVAPTYDLLNHLLSFNIDRGWRKRLMNRMAPVLSRRDARILDLCCGTGDVLLDLQSVAATVVMGADFCHPMLVSAQQKIQRRHFRSQLFEADALQLPLRDSSFDALSISFGFRNLTDYEAGLRELHRVLKPGGILALLEFSHPPGFFVKTAYGLYSNLMLPTIGRLVSGSRDAYSYLPKSIQKFPQADQLLQMMRTAGFRNADFELLTGGIAALHVGTK
jgi:demethylmenaquinone methyltransferase/2-methoxy-6-polyprenyl-1,4-benzoquinol methylase